MILVKFFETKNGIKGSISTSSANNRLTIICQGVPGNRVEGRNYLRRIERNTPNSDVIRFEPVGVGYSFGHFDKLTHQQWVKNIVDVAKEFDSLKYIAIDFILMSDSGKLIIDLYKIFLKDFYKEWNIIFLSGVLLEEEVTSPIKSRFVLNNDDEWVIYTGFGVHFSFDFLTYYPDIISLKQFLLENKKRVYGIYGTSDELTAKSAQFLQNNNITVYRIKDGDHLFTNYNTMNQSIMDLKEIYHAFK